MLNRLWKKKEHVKLIDIEYSTKKMLDLSDSNINECAKLFSNSYGK